MICSIVRQVSATFAVASAFAFAASPAQATAFTFTNATPISIPSSGTATPYPSTIAVSAVTGTILDVNVTLNEFSHTTPDDVGVLLVGPTGAGTIVFDGGTLDTVTNANLTFADGGASWPGGGPVGTGTFQPFSFYSLDQFPAPAPLIANVNPTVNMTYTFTPFDGTNPNGTWSLYVVDFVPGDSGSIAGGWTLDLEIETADVTAVPEPATLSLLVLGLAGSAVRRRRNRR